MIDVIEVKNCINELKKIKDNYYNTCINYYYILDEISDCWKTNRGFAFYDVICREKKYYLRIVDNIEDLLQVFIYLVEKYEVIGDRIVFDFKLEDKYVGLKKSLVDSMNDIVNLYKNVNLSNYGIDLENLFDVQKNNLIKYVNNINNLCKNNRDIVNSIRDIESQVKSSLSKIDIEVVNVTDIKDYELNINKTVDIYVTDVEKMKYVYNRSQVYINDENDMLNDINELFIKISEFYKTENLDVIEKLECEIIIGINNILKIHKLNLDVLAKEIVNVEELERKSNDNIKNISSMVVVDGINIGDGSIE